MSELKNKTLHLCSRLVYNCTFHRPNDTSWKILQRSFRDRTLTCLSEACMEQLVYANAGDKIFEIPARLGKKKGIGTKGSWQKEGDGKRKA